MRNLIIYFICTTLALNGMSQGQRALVQTQLGEEFCNYFPFTAFFKDSVLKERQSFLMASFYVNKEKKVSNFKITGILKDTTKYYIINAFQKVIDSSSLKLFKSETNYVIPLFLRLTSIDYTDLKQLDSVHKEAQIRHRATDFYELNNITGSLSSFADEEIVFEGKTVVLSPIDISQGFVNNFYAKYRDSIITRMKEKRLKNK